MKRYRVLKGLIWFNKYKTFVEVGVADGVTSRYLLDTNSDPEFKIWGIDPYIEYEDYRGGICSSLESVTNNRAKMEERLVAEKRYTHLYDYSHNVVGQFKDESIDIVFIDGDHSYSAVKQDIEDWWPKVRKGGILSGHDLKRKPHFGVIPAVKEFSLKYNLPVQHGGDHVWIINKP